MRPAHMTRNTVCILARPNGQPGRNLSYARLEDHFLNHYLGDLPGSASDLIGGLIGCRPCRRPHRLSYSNLIGDIKDKDELAGDIRIDLTVDLFLAYWLNLLTN